jgi:hypothetical protein
LNKCWFDLLQQIVSRLAKATYQLRIALKDVDGETGGQRVSNGVAYLIQRKNLTRVNSTLEVSLKPKES